jgi:thymidylate synthase (FAD)
MGNHVQYHEDAFKTWHEHHKCSECDGVEYKPGDEKLLRFLWENKHHTPFEMAGMTIEVQAPIMVFREWHRHRTQSYNEMSGRYVEIPDMCYIPSLERLMAGKQAKKNKQSSEEGFTGGQAWDYQEILREAYAHARNHYNHLLEQGVARELARLVLPVAVYSKMRASANLRNWLAFLQLRMDAGAQWEIRQYAEAVGGFVAERFPRTYELFQEGR